MHYHRKCQRNICIGMKGEAAIFLSNIDLIGKSLVLTAPVE